MDGTCRDATLATMRPAFSVIFFSVLSGAGYGLLACAAIAAMVGPPSTEAQSFATIVVMAMALVLVGLGSSVVHLGRPARAWRAFSQWRSSWLSREGVSATLSFLPALFLAALLWMNQWGLVTRVTAGASLLLAAATIFCTARIYTSLPPIPAWRGPLVLPGYFLFAGTTGLALWLALSGALLGATSVFAATSLAVLALATAMVKWRYWRDIDAIEMPSTARMTGLDRIGETRSFEAPHTEANYLTREMGFQFARRHARVLRATVVAALIAVAAIAIVTLTLPSIRDAAHPPTLAAALGVFASLLALLAAIVERWLFFAQARHMVMAYYER